MFDFLIIKLITTLIKNLKMNLKNVYLVDLYSVIILKCTMQTNKKFWAFISTKILNTSVLHL
jgi:hypothetical protein